MALSNEAQGKAEADRFRAAHQLGAQPLGDLVALIEQTTGHDVAVLDAEPDEHGLTMRDPERGVVFIGVARTEHPMRQRSTLAHELAHLTFGDRTEARGTRTPEEVRADAFARHLLAPAAGVGAFLGGAPRDEGRVLSATVQRYLVCPQIAAIVLRDCGYASEDVAATWMTRRTWELATRFGWSDQYASLQKQSDRLRAPQGLVARATAGYAAGVVSAEMIANLRGMPTEAVVAELSAASIEPAEPDAEEFEIRDFPDVRIDVEGLLGEDDSA